jgi:hypothetical protein
MEGLKNSIRHVHQDFLPAPISYLFKNKRGNNFLASSG